MPESTQASGALAVVHELLSSTNLLTSEEPIEGGRRFRITLDGPAEEGTIEVHTDLERVALALVFPSPVPQKRRSAMAKLIGYINWGLMEGAFALSLDSGQLCYKAGFGYAGTTLPGPLVRLPPRLLEGTGPLPAREGQAEERDGEGARDPHGRSSSPEVDRPASASMT
ncbi:MAG: hypothetical protein DYH06_20830 [Acidobacteria bacterium ACB2]|nr:hypothetical protein [Acidobacteria bacterium ACB2]